MSRPDLNSPEGRRSYRAELAGVARAWRWVGLSLVALGAAGLYATRISDMPLLGSPLGLATLAALVVGWGLAIVGIVKRTGYHRRRMGGWPGPAAD